MDTEWTKTDYFGTFIVKLFIIYLRYIYFFKH